MVNVRIVTTKVEFLSYFVIKGVDIRAGVNGDFVQSSSAQRHPGLTVKVARDNGGALKTKHSLANLAVLKKMQTAISTARIRFLTS